MTSSLFTPPVIATELSSIKLASWNIGHFSYGASSLSSIPTADAQALSQRFRTFIDDLGADTVGICKYSEDFDVGGTLKASSALFGDFPLPSIGPRNSYQWNAAFYSSRFEILETLTIPYTTRTQRTYYLAHRVKVDHAYEAWFVQTHWDWSATAVRLSQAAQLVEAFKDFPRVVISGDFNNTEKLPDGTSHTAWSDLAAFSEAGYHIALTEEGLTAPDHEPLRTIDNIFAKGFAISDAKAIPGNTHPIFICNGVPYGLSDHRAVSCTLTPLSETEVAIPTAPPYAF